MRENWGSEKIVTRNTIHDATEVPGFIAEQNGKPAGIVLYHIKSKDCEIVLLASFVEKIGIGSALIDSVKRVAWLQGCRRKIGRASCREREEMPKEEMALMQAL